MTAASHVLEMRDVLLRMAARGATGTMIVQAEGRVLAVSFEQGEIVSADLNEAFEEGLGPVLVAEGFMSAREMGQVGEGLRGLSQAVPRLREGGAIDEPELQLGLRAYVSDLLLRLLRWDERDFQFYDSDSLDEVVRLYPISVEELLVSAADEVPGLLGGEVPKLGKATYRRVMGPNDMGGESRGRRGGGASLTRLEERAIRLADGATPSSRYCEELGSDEHRVRFALYRLLEARLIEPYEEALDLAPPGFDPDHESPAETRGGSFEELLGAAQPGEDTLAGLRGPALAPTSRREWERFFDGLSLAWACILGMAAIGFLVITVVMAPSARDWVLPFPWQGKARQEMLQRQWQAVDLRLRGALVADFLLLGELPKELGHLTEKGLLSARDLYGPDGSWLAYRQREDGYTVGSSASPASMVREHSTAGDWLLDPDVLSGTQQLLDRPLILLD